MPIAVANVASLPATPQADAAQAARNSSRTGSADPFQTVLAEARAGVPGTRPADDIDDTLPTDATEDTDNVDDATSDLAGVLVGVAQAVIPNDTPVNFAEAELLTSGQPVPDGQNGITPQLDSNPTAPPTRSNPLFRQFVSDASPRNNTQITPPVTQNATPATPTPTTPVVPQTVASAASQPLLTPPAALTSAVAAVQPAQRQVVPAQAPIVAGPLPNAAPVNADDLPDPIVAPQGVVAAAALPSAAVGDRPTTAGEQFAAIASTAQTLTPTAAPAEPFPATATPITATAPTVTTPAATVAAPAAPLAAPVAPLPAPAPTELAAPTPLAAPASIATPTEPVVPAEPAAPAPAATNVAGRAVTVADGTSLATTAVIVNPLVPPTPLAESTVPPDADRDRGDAFAIAAAPGTPAQSAPAAPSAARAPAAVQPASPAVQIAVGIVTHAAVVEQAGATEFRIRLDPPELGPVRVRLVASGDSIHGQVVVSDDAIRRMIESQLPELRQRLEAAGVTVQTFDVTTDAGTGGSGGRNAYRADALTDPARPGLAPAIGPRASGPRAAGVLDVTV